MADERAGGLDDLSGPEIIALYDRLFPPKIVKEAHESFIGQLSLSDLNILRKVVKKVHMAYYPPEMKIANREADRIIEAMGPETIQSLIKTAVDKYGAGR